MSINTNLQNTVAALGTNVSLPNQNRPYCTFDSQRTTNLVNAGEEAVPYIDTFLKSATTEEQVLDGLQVLDKMLDNNVKGIDKIYPTLSLFNNVTSPNVQVYLSGIYRKTLVPDAFGPLTKMLYRQTVMPNSPYFDPTEEIGGAIYEYLKNQSVLNTAGMNIQAQPLTNKQ